MSIRLEHRFTVPVPVEEAWDVLLDVERVAPCMPGATLESVDGDAFTGKVRVKVGPITVTYRGEARITEKDPRTRTVRIEASGKEARGSGTASGTVLARLAGPEGSTEVTVETDITVTGRVAQFGRGVMADVSERLVSRFADNLAAELAGSGGSEPEPAAAEPAAPPESGAGAPRRSAPPRSGPGPRPAPPGRPTRRRSTCSAPPGSRCSSASCRCWPGPSSRFWCCAGCAGGAAGGPRPAARGGAGRPRGDAQSAAKRCEAG
ncbi:SRPBCC family protein [Nocardiopsis composta]